MRENLRIRGIDVDLRCPWCSEEKQTLSHALFLCHEVQRAWKISLLRLDVHELKGVPFRRWIEGLGGRIQESTWWDNFWSLLWGMWLRRNAWVFEKKRFDIEEVVSKASRIVLEYLDCMCEMSVDAREVAEKKDHMDQTRNWGDQD